MRIIAVMITFLVVGFATGRAEPPSGAAATPAPSATTDPILAYYPPAALAARLAGVATLTCDGNEHGALTNCSLLNETPAGAGFGAAALALAAHSIEFPTLKVPEMSRFKHEITFGFAPSPPMISPDVLTEPWSWPTADVEWMGLGFTDPGRYPGGASVSHVTGYVLLLCALRARGWLADCQVIQETPSGYGFGQAALSLTHQMRLKLHGMTKDAPDRRTALFPIHFAPPVQQGRRTLDWW